MRASRASTAEQDLVALAKRPRLPVPRSNAAVEVVISLAQSRRIDHGPAVMVRCAACRHRLFDLRAAGDGLRSLVVTRKCPQCKCSNTGLVTHVPGHPLDAPDALDGGWWCACGQLLGRIDAGRGRITVPCRHCKDNDTREKVKIRVIAADAIAVAYREEG